MTFVFQNSNFNTLNPKSEVFSKILILSLIYLHIFNIANNKIVEIGLILVLKGHYYLETQYKFCNITNGMDKCKRNRVKPEFQKPPAPTRTLSSIKFLTYVIIIIAKHA